MNMERKRKKLVIIPEYNDLYLDKITGFINKKFEIVVVSLNSDKTESERLGEDIVCKDIDDYKGGISLDVHDEVLSWMYEWSNKKIKDGKNFKELMLYKNLSLWWCIRYWFYQKLSEIFQKIRIIDSIITTENPDNIIVIEKDKDIIGKITYQISNKGNIPVSVIQIQHSKLKEILSSIGIYLRILKYGIFSIFLSTPLNIVYKIKWINKKKGDGSKIVITSCTQHYESTKKDYMFDGIVKELFKRNSEPLVITRGHHFDSRFLNIFKEPYPYKPYEIYFNYSIRKNILLASLSLKKILSELREDKNFRRSLFYNEIFLGDILETMFPNFFLRFFVKGIEQIEIWNNIIKKEEPDILVTESEGYSHALALISISREKQIPVIALQHGLSGPLHTGYIYKKDEVSMDIDDMSKYPLADKTAVYGPYSKKVLTEMSAYPEDSVVVTGQPRYDILARASEVFNKKKTFEKLNLDDDKKLIVWAADLYIFNEISKEHIYAVFDAVKKLSNNVQLVVKKHPEYYFDDSVYNKIAQKFEFVPIIIRKMDTLELLYASDLVIMEQSTVGIEAMILDKPVITLNFSGEPEDVPYAGSGAALGVYKEEDLVINIKKALYDKEAREKLKKAREKFVYERAYLQDGKATERFCDLIEGMIKNEGHIQK